MTVAATASTPAAQDTTAIGRTRLAQNFDMFLTLLTTQMKNQDPTSPMDSSQFMSQLVQMTGVEQQLASNDLLKKLVANTGTSVASAVGLIGKQVRAATSDAALSNGQAQWGYALNGDAAEVTAVVTDSLGRTIAAKAFDAADSKAGEHSFVWDGKDMNGARQPDGVYTLKLTAKDASGQTVGSSTFVQGLVTGLEQQNGAAVVTVNGGKIGLDALVSVSKPPAPASGSAAGTNPSTPADQTSAQAA